MSVASSRRSSAASSRGSRGRTAEILYELEHAPNPFTMPSDEEVFVLREEERNRKLQERRRLQNLKVHEKTTWGTRQATAKVAGIEEYSFDMPAEDEEEAAPEEPKKISRGAKDKETMSDFILKKREMFLVQMSLNTKRDEILKLEQRAHARDLALKESEAMLVADDERFQQFIRENDEQAHDAMTRAEKETKARSQRVQEIKQLNAEIKTVDSEISKLEDKLNDCFSYREFLLECTPDEWHEAELEKEAVARAEGRLAAEEEAAKEAKEEAEQDARAAAEEAGEEYQEPEPEPEEAAQAAASARAARLDALVTEERAKVNDEDVPLYFTESSQLGEYFMSLEEDNLFQMQRTQETEVMFEDVRRKHNDKEHAMQKEADGLKKQIKELHGLIQTEQDRRSALQARAQAAEHDPELEVQAADFQRQTAEIRKVFLVCFPEQAGAGDDLDAIEMLTRIEKKIEETFQELNAMQREVDPSTGEIWNMERAEKGKQKARRQLERVRIQKEAKEAQEERIKQSLKKAMEPVIKKTGKPIMFRSAPPRRHEQVSDEVVDDQEELDRQYFFA